MRPILPDSMAQTTEDWSFNEDILAVFSNPDAHLRSLAPCSRTLSTDPDVIFISPPTSPLTLLPNQIANDEPVSPDSTSTIEASDNDPAVEASTTAGVHFIADDTNEYQNELPPACSFPTDCSPLLSCPNQIKHHAKTANSVHSHQYHNDSLASKPTANIRPRINYLLRHGLKTEFNSWEMIFWDNQRKELTIRIQLYLPNASRLPKKLLLPFLIYDFKFSTFDAFLNSIESFLLFPLSPPINFCSLSVGWVKLSPVTEFPPISKFRKYLSENSK